VDLADITVSAAGRAAAGLVGAPERLGNITLVYGGPGLDLTNNKPIATDSDVSIWPTCSGRQLFC